MRTLVYATALGALLMASSAQAAVTLDFQGNTSTWVLYQGTKVPLPDGGGLVANTVHLNGGNTGPSTKYGATTIADVQVDGGNSASFTSGVAGRGANPTGDNLWGADASSTSGIIATITNTGGAPVHLNSIQSTIIQAGMGFMIQNPTIPIFTNPDSGDSDPFTDRGLNPAGKFGDFLSLTSPGATIARAGFSFNVYGDSYETLGDAAPALFTLNGSVSLGFDALGHIVETSNVADAESILNGFAPIYPTLDGFGNPLPITNADNIAGFEWNETDVPIALNQLLGAGLSTKLYYVATSYVDVAMPCVSATECLVAYSGFGDPVGRGGGVSADFASQINNFSSLPPDPCPHDTSRICFSPQTITPFSNLRTSGGVPEPAVWVSMIVGFGLAGAALRRRGALSQA